MEFKNSKTANRRRYKSRYHSPHNYKTKRSKSENRAAILVAIATFLVIASLVLIFTFGDSIYSYVDGLFHPAPASPDEAAAVVQDATEPTADPSAVPDDEPTQEPTEPPAEPPTEGPTEPPVQQSAEFESLIGAAGLKVSDLSGSQMILVKSAGTSATVYTYEKNSAGLWVQKFSPMKGYVGAGGVAAAVGPKDNTTPTGTYRIEYAMGINSDPGTLLKYYKIETGMSWIVTPTDTNYNRWIRTETNNGVDQWLANYTISYPYAVIFDYNRDPVDPAMGCAKFLHVSAKPTEAGGVGISEADLRSILLWLNPDQSPTITIY